MWGAKDRLAMNGHFVLYWGKFVLRPNAVIMTSEKFNIELMPASFSAWAPQEPASRQIAMLMSGGVDSSVAAHLL